MSKDFFIHSRSNEKHACLKILNDAGEELSVAFDDSCGAMLHLGRASFARFGANNECLREDSPLYGAEDFLLLLAEHLGYVVAKREDSDA